MELFILILIFLALIGVSNVINHQLPSIPVPLIQIALGSAVTFISPHFHLHLEPELFFVLFIAPLLYNDGKHTPRSELWRLRAPIFLLAVGLVFATVFVVGYFIHWMIPSIPLPVAFGLAAILSPTDAVAVGALAGRIHLPKSLMHLLEGEALMNDASGLVAFKFAIAAAVTGVFSLSKASVSFLVIFIGGLAVGAILAVVITGIRSLLRRSGLENETLHMLIHILTPFALFLTAEELGLSGILAAVAGGVMHAIERDHSHKIKSRPNELADNTWSIIVYLLNGLVFVILGVQLPNVFSAVFKSSAFNNFVVGGYALAIYILLIVLRFLWVFAYARFNGAKKPNVSFKLLAMTSLSGVRGALTLAGTLTIPLFIDNGDPFPERSLVIFLSAFVIVLSLLAASIFLPLLAKNKGMHSEEESARQQYEGQLRSMRSAMQAVRHATTEENESEAAVVISQYDRWIRQSQLNERRQRKQRRQQDVVLRIKAVEIERDRVRQLLNGGEISGRHAELLLKNLEEIELIESGRRQFWVVVLKRLTNGIKRFLSGKPSKISVSDWEALRKIKLQTTGAVIEAFESNGAGSDESEATDVINHYRFIRDQLSAPFPVSQGNEHIKRDLQWIAIQAERNEVQSLYEQNEITREVANGLRRNIRGREASILENEWK
ncbi:Na+/H+ antiporter [Paenibacillus piri]|uniref:Na+/H+ antiporter n=1 Tax=Paenibacillus piri TaxID=2547395 RepID=A0A4R5KBI2_9BACL|nr:Na+/H+ antiporter [Paenibacillus piri]TDF92539.1 Na+/H+ antiporter [Paenibacillus piri]